MSMIQKMELGYLQFLRFVFLLAATGAIVLAGVLSFRFLADHNAKPVPVLDKVQLNLASYKPKALDKDSSSDSKQTEAQMEAPLKDPVLETFINILDKNGKKLVQGWSINREPVVNFFNEMDNDPNLGRAFLTQLMPILDAGLQRPDVVKRINGEGNVFGKEAVSLIAHFKEQYKLQTQAIAAKERAATADAVERQSEATRSLYMAGILFGSFVGLVLLIVLLKIERNLRNGITLTKVEQRTA